MKKKNLIRVLVIVFIVWIMCFFDCSFAEEVAKSDPLDSTASALHTLVSVLSWFWVYLANLAWTFLTNNWIYAEALKLDVLLRKFWNVIKNMANFCLWFYFLYIVFKWLFNKDEIMKKLKTSLLWILVAWVWIQASWFFTAVVIDISSITLAAAWSLPSQVVSENKNLESALKKSFWWKDSLSKWIEISLFSKNAKASSFIDVHEFNLDTPITFDTYVDSIMPNPDNVAWPLYYMWYSILNTMAVASINDSSSENLKWTILTTIMQWWTTIVFGIEMAVLCVIALIRVVYLWMFIVFSPFAVLLWCLKKSWEKWWDFVKSFEKYIGLKVFFWNVFKPTIIVLGFWLATMFVSLMTAVVKENTGKNFDMWWVVAFSVKDWQSNINWNVWDQKFTTSLYSETLDIDLKNAWKTLLEFILSIITVLIVYYIIKISITIWGWDDFVSKKAKGLQENVWKFLTETPIVPFASYDDKWVKHNSGISLEWLKKIPEQWNQSHGVGALERYKTDQVDAVLTSWWAGADGKSLSETQKQWLKSKFASSSSNIEDVRNYIDGIKTDSWLWMKLDRNKTTDYTWINEFGGWLDKKAALGSYSGPLSLIVNKWKNMPEDDKKSRNYQKLFDNENRLIEEYVKFFNLNGDVNDWSSLWDADISKKSTSSSETK